MKASIATFAAVLWVGAAIPASGSPAKVPRTVLCEGASYRYLLVSPPGNRPKPAILLLHGAGGQASDLLAFWEPFALSNGIALIAPQLPREEAFESAAPAVFRCVVEDAKTVVPVDPRRIYVFGHSMGGYLAYDAAMFESEYFAAVAVHAAAIADGYTGILSRAKRRIPIAIFIGDRDTLVALDGVRRTRDLLVREGFPVEFEELKGHDHDYGALADRINRDAWRFLEAHPLP